MYFSSFNRYTCNKKLFILINGGASGGGIVLCEESLKLLMKFLHVNRFKAQGQHSSSSSESVREPSTCDQTFTSSLLGKESIPKT